MKELKKKVKLWELSKDEIYAICKEESVYERERERKKTLRGLL